MKKKLFIIAMICSVIMSVQAFRGSNFTSLLLKDNVEALSDDDEAEIVCGRYEGRCWAGTKCCDYRLNHWDCWYFTGYMVTQCKSNWDDFLNWDYQYWLDYAEQNNLIP